MPRTQVIEGRTVESIEDLLEFCQAVVAVTHADPSTIRLHVAQDMRVTEVTRPDGAKAYDVKVSSAG